MSVSSNRLMIQCDSKDCLQTAPIPVALKAELSGSLGKAGSTCEGWLFVRRGNRTEHYCPLHNKAMLALMMEETAR